MTRKRRATVRVRDGVREALFGGYAVWWLGSRRIVREVRVWAPASIDDTDCGPGTAEIVRRLTRTADPNGTRNVVISESWRYSPYNPGPLSSVYD